MVGPVARRARLRARGLRPAAVGAAVAALLCLGAVGVGAQVSAPPAVAPSAQILPLPSPTLCVLVICLPDASQGTTTTPTPTATPTPTSTPCPLCLPTLPPTCSITTDPTCLLATPTPCQTCGTPGGSSQTPGRPTPRTTASNRPTNSATSTPGGLGLGGSGDSGPGQGGGTTVPLGISVANVPVVEQLSPVSGLQFGHAPILWPLFGALDLLGLVVVGLVVRRLRTAGTD